KFPPAPSAAYGAIPSDGGTPVAEGVADGASKALGGVSDVAKQAGSGVAGTAGPLSDGFKLGGAGVNVANAVTGDEETRRDSINKLGNSAFEEARDRAIKWLAEKVGGGVGIGEGVGAYFAEDPTGHMGTKAQDTPPENI